MAVRVGGSSISLVRIGSVVQDAMRLGSVLVWEKPVTGGFVDGLAAFLTSWPGVHTAFSFNNTDVNSGTDSAMVAQFASYATADTGVYANAGLDGQCSPTANYGLDIYIITDAAMLLYIPPDMPTSDCILFHNGGSTHGQQGMIRSLNNGETVLLGIMHNANGSTNQDYTSVEIAERGWIMAGFQFDDGANNMAIWVNGQNRQEIARTLELSYGGGDPRIGGGNAPPIPGWGTGTIGDGNVLIANFVADNPGQTNSAPDGAGDSFYTDYYAAMTT